MQAYSSDRLYVGGAGAPDYLFIMPRRMSPLLMIIDHFLDCVLERSAEGQETCRVLLEESQKDGALEDWAFSYWPLKYMTVVRHAVLSTRLLGSATLLVRDGGNSSLMAWLKGSADEAHLGCGAWNCGRRPINVCPPAWLRIKANPP